MPMATENCTQQIGETAGQVWHTLHEEGQPLSLAQLAKKVGGNRDTVMQAVGWLAREGKVVVEDTGRSKTVSLCDS